MDDLEDLVKLNSFLKTGAFAIKNCQTSANLSLVEEEEEEQEINLNQVSEEIEQDVKHAEEKMILNRIEFLSASGITLPSNANELLTFLNKDEIGTIERSSCIDLKRIMLLNRTKRLQLLNVLKQILELRNIIDKMLWNEKKKEEIALSGFRSPSSTLGTPFFKLRNNKVSCWSNPDVERKRHNNELMLCRVIPSSKWTEKDKLLLKGFVSMYYKYSQERDVLCKIETLKNLPEYNTTISQLEKELCILRYSEDAYPPIDCGDNIDWYEVSDQFKGRHSATECRVHWNMYLHPQRNTGNWTKMEDRRLITLAKSYHCQNWDYIAKELGTFRSPFQTCSRYYGKLCINNFRREKFSPQEDKVLLEIIKSCKIGNYIPWAKVAYYFEGRTKSQLYHRYTYFLAPKNQRKTIQFTFVEDALIMALVERIGKNFSKIASLVPNRSAMQIKNRYNCYLQNPDLTYRPFSIEEDRRILEHGTTYGKAKWGGLAKEMNLPRSHIRHRYNALSNWLAKNPNRTWKDMPRRYLSKANELNAKFEQLKRVTDTLRDLQHTPSLQDVKKAMVKQKLTIRNQSSCLKKTLHSDLVDFFRTGFKISRAFSVVAEDNRDKDADIVDRILNILGANLELPEREKIENDPNLDRLDVFFLNHLACKNNSKGAQQNCLKWALPPNIGTTVGLRNMILALSLKKRQPLIRYTAISNSSEKPWAGERTLFQQRLQAIFRWPSVMSLVNVNEVKLSVSQERQKSSDSILRKRGRPKKDYVKINLRIQNMQEGRQQKRSQKLLGSLMSVNDLAKSKSLSDDVDCESSVSKEYDYDMVNINASTSQDFLSHQSDQNDDNLCVRRTGNVRTYKRKREASDEPHSNNLHVKAETAL